MARKDVQVFERVSDVTPEEWLLSDQELFRLCDQRFAALTPSFKRPSPELEKRLHVWLDDHNVYPKRGSLDARVRALPHEGLISLLQVLEDWRVEASPPGEHGEFE